MRRWLDERAQFIDEDGVVAGRRDFHGGGPAAPPNGTSSKVTVTDWVLHHTGNVAVSSFVDDQVVHYGGQDVDYRFLSVEAWIRRGGTWRLFSSGTIPLHQDPPPASLAEETLNDYVGAYTVGPGSLVTIARDKAGLAVSANGAKPTPLAAEARDVFFTPDLPPGYSRPRAIFQRDAQGRVTGYLRQGIAYAKLGPAAAPAPATGQPSLGPLKLRDFVVHRSGDIAVATFFHDRDTPVYGQILHQTYRSSETWIKRGAAWKMITSQGRSVPTDPPATTLPAEQLNDYPGVYAAVPALSVTISRQGDGLAASTNGGKPVLLLAEVRDVFFTPGAPRTSIIFRRDGGGRVTGYVSRREERDLLFRKT